MRKLKMLGILWCNGNPDEKTAELYNSIVDNKSDTIVVCDKDFKPNFFQLCEFATEMPYNFAEKW